MDYIRCKLAGKKTPSCGREISSRSYAPSNSQGSLPSIWTPLSSSRRMSESTYTSEWGLGSSVNQTPLSPTPSPRPTMMYPWRKSSTSYSTTNTDMSSKDKGYKDSMNYQGYNKNNMYNYIAPSSPSLYSYSTPDSRCHTPKYSRQSWRPERSSPSPKGPKSRVALGQTKREPDYRILYEKEKEEKEVVGARLAELELQQKVLEENLKKFLDLKNDLSNFNEEAVETDKVLNDFIKAVVPDFPTAKQSGQKDVGNPLGRSGHHTFRAQVAEADPDLPSSKSPSPQLPLPQVAYNWSDVHPCRPINRLSYSIPTRLDELKLELVFDVGSSSLPTKLQLEIRDRTGRVVFRKRQNVYYVKVQERLSSLDAEEDYMMTVTSICGPRQASEEVPIHSKYFSPTEERGTTTVFSFSESMTLPNLESVTTCRSPSAASLTSGFDEKSIDSIFDSPLKNMEAHYDSLCRDTDTYREVTNTPGIPDLEEVVDIQFTSTSEDESIGPDIDLTTVEENEDQVGENSSRKINPFHLSKKPIIPEIVYRWQKGFRRGQNGQYQKVAILKLEMKYCDSVVLLPTELSVSAGGLTKTVVVCGKVASIELEGQPDNIRVESGEGDPGVPAFNVEPTPLEKTELGVWHSVQPVLCLQL